VKFLLRKGEAKKIVPSLRLLARVATEDHAMDRHFVPLVATFDSPNEVDAVVTRVSTSRDPVFMAPCFDFFYGDLEVYNITTVAEAQATFLYTAFEAKWVYPVSHTRYRIATKMSWAKLMLLASECADRIAELSNDRGELFEPARPIDGSETEEDPSEQVTVKLTGFPLYINKRALLEAVSSFDASSCLEAAHFTSDGKSLLATVDPLSKLANCASQDEALQTAFGEIAVRVVKNPMHIPDQAAKGARHVSMNQLLNLFGPLGNEKESEERGEDRVSKRKKENEKANERREERKVEKERYIQRGNG
jgi:hypothetical protein